MRDFGRITGRVEIFDSRGNKLWDCSNMITSGGLQAFAILSSTNWNLDSESASGREYSPTYVHLGDDSWSGVDFNADVKSLKSPIDTYIPSTGTSRSVDSSIKTEDLIDLGGNSVTYQFDYLNTGTSALSIRELGLFSKNRILLAYERINGATISAELEMTLLIKWTITFK